MSNSLTDRVKENNNQFLESVREYYLNDLFNLAYNGKKKKMIKRWLKNSTPKILLLRLIDTADRPDFVSDSLLIRLWPDRFDINVVDISEDIKADIEMNTTHTAMVMSTGSIESFLIAMLKKKIRLPKLCRNIRDHYYAARLFFT